MKTKKLLFNVRLPIGLLDAIRRESDETGLSQAVMAEDAFTMLLNSREWKEIAERRRTIRGIPSAKTENQPMFAP